MSDAPAIDAAVFASLVDMTGGDLAFVDELVDTYLEDGAAQVEALRAAVESGVTADLVRPAHSLKSSSLNVGAVRLAGLCRTLEEAARSASVPHAAEWVGAIAVGFEETRGALLDERGRRAQG